MDGSFTEILRRSRYLYDRETAFDSIVRHAHDKLDAESCAIFLRHPRNKNELILEASYCDKLRHIAKLGMKLEIKAETKSGLTGAIMHESRIFREEGHALKVNPFVKGMTPGHLIGGACHSLLAVPFWAKSGEHIGLLKVENKKLNGHVDSEIGFSLEDETTALKLGEGLVRFLDNFGNFEAFSGVQAALGDITREIGFAPELLRSCCSFFGFEGAILYRADHENGILRPIAFAGNGSRGAELKYNSNESTFVSQVFTEGSNIAPDPFKEPVHQFGRDLIGIQGPIGGVQILNGQEKVAVVVFWMPSGGIFSVDCLELLGVLLQPVGAYLLEREELRSAEMFHHSLIQSSPAALFVKDLKGRFLFCNQFFCEFADREHQSLIGQTDHGVFPSQFADQFVKDDLHVISTGETLNKDERSCNSKGEPRFVRVVKSPLKSQNGETIGLQGVFIDVTEERLADASRVAKLGYWHWDVDFDTLSGSREVYRLFEFPADEKLTFEQAFLSKVHELDRELVRSEIESLREQPRPFEKRFRVVMKNGSTGVFEIKGEPLRLASEAGMVEMFGYIQDVTDFVLLRGQAVQTARIRASSDVAAFIRHDLSNTLAGLQFDLATLTEQQGSNVTFNRMEVAVQQALGLAKLLRTISGQEKLDLGIQDMNSIVIDALNLEKQNFKNDGVVDFFVPAWEAPKVYAIKSHLMSIVGNLIRNAREAMPSGGELRVKLSQRKRSGSLSSQESGMGFEIVLEIIDTGSGLTHVDEKSIFQKGFSRKPGSSGVRGWGLYSCRRIADLYYGTVTIRNRNDCTGAVAEVVLPALVNVLYGKENSPGD